MSVIDLTDRTERQKAVEHGYIWSAPEGAVRAALADIKAGYYPAPATIPSRWLGVAAAMGVVPAEQGGLMEGQGPA